MVVETQYVSRTHRSKTVEGARKPVVFQEIGISERETGKFILYLVCDIIEGIRVLLVAGTVESPF